MSSDEILLDAEERMEKAVSVFREELRGIRTGQATPGLVDTLRVEVYGSPVPLKQIASVGVPEPAMIVIRPFDPGTLSDIVKAIQASDLGLAPNSDGRVVRLNVPPLSTERRRQLTHRVNELAEAARIAIRNIRRDANRHGDREEKEKLLSEDDCKRLKEEVQNLTKQYEEQVNQLAQQKDAEMMEG
jgi:ribosome recycling factor